MTPQRLDGSYIRGYTRAIMDLQEVFLAVEREMRMRRRGALPFRQIHEILGVALENREGIREKDGGFVRWNAAKKNFEFYRPEV